MSERISRRSNRWIVDVLAAWIVAVLLASLSVRYVWSADGHEAIEHRVRCARMAEYVGSITRLDDLSFSMLPRHAATLKPPQATPLMMAWQWVRIRRSEHEDASPEAAEKWCLGGVET